MRTHAARKGLTLQRSTPPYLAHQNASHHHQDSCRHGVAHCAASRSVCSGAAVFHPRRLDQLKVFAARARLARPSLALFQKFAPFCAKCASRTHSFFPPNRPQPPKHAGGTPVFPDSLHGNPLCSTYCPHRADLPYWSSNSAALG